jgi:hypothetical protein
MRMPLNGVFDCRRQSNGIASFRAAALVSLQNRFGDSLESAGVIPSSRCDREMGVRHAAEGA